MTGHVENETLVFSLNLTKTHHCRAYHLECIGLAIQVFQIGLKRLKCRFREVSIV